MRFSASLGSVSYSPVFKSLHFSPAGHPRHHLVPAETGSLSSEAGSCFRNSNGCVHFLSILALLLICKSITSQLNFRKMGLSFAESFTLLHADKYLKQKHFYSYTLVQWHPWHKLCLFTSSLLLHLTIFSNLQKTDLYIQWNQVQDPLPAAMSEIFS